MISNYLKQFGKAKKREPAPKQAITDSKALADLEPFHKSVIEYVKPFTMTSPERVFSLLETTRFITQQNIPGAFVECGVWKGGSIMAMVKACQNTGDLSRDFYLFDSFEGMPLPGKVDIGYNGVSAETLFYSKERMDGNRVNWCLADESEVLKNLIATGYPPERFHIHKGMVEDTLKLKDNLPEKIALLRLDTDWYESTKLEWEILYPRVVGGGFIIIDDYGHWKGSQKATDEFLDQLSPRPFLFRIDYTARIMQKPRV